MYRLLTFLFLFYSCINTNGQHWINNCVPADIGHTTLLVEKIDSVGMRCREGKKHVYCNDFDRDTDRQLISFQKQQESLFKKYHFSYMMVLPKAFPYQEYVDLHDLDKYRYIFRIHTYSGMGDKSNECWMYYFYDRKTKKNFKRIPLLSSGRFSSLKEIIAIINENFTSDKK